MAYRVDLTKRAARDLRRVYRTINAEDSAQARDWFNGLEKAVFSLDENPARAPVMPEDDSLRHLLYGRKPNVYRAYGGDRPPLFGASDFTRRAESTASTDGIGGIGNDHRTAQRVP
jgi:toxin ParE1/3/4